MAALAITIEHGAQTPTRRDGAFRKTFNSISMSSCLFTAARCRFIRQNLNVSGKHLLFHPAELPIDVTAAVISLYFLLPHHLASGLVYFTRHPLRLPRSSAPPALKR